VVSGKPRRAYQNLAPDWSEKSLYDKTLIFSSAAFLAFFAFFLLLHQAFLTPDQFFAVAFLVGLVLGQSRRYLWDWTPVLLLIFGYEYLRGIIPLINHHVYFNPMPRFDTWVFGEIPAVSLQYAFYDPQHLHWYDYAGAVLYLSHFIVPLLAAYVFWSTGRKYFREFAIGIISLSYLSFLTYFIFPAAPPWMAAQRGLIPPVEEITGLINTHFFSAVHTFSIYPLFGINETAAVPSLHAAFPLLTAIYLGKKYRKLIPLLVLYVGGVWLSVIYLGEHYVFDVLVGAVYALAVYALVRTGRAAFAREKSDTNFADAAGEDRPTLTPAVFAVRPD